MNAFLSQYLHAAAAAGEIDAVRSRVVHGAAINARDEHGRTPLFISVLNGQWAVAAFWVSHGAEPYASDRQGVSPVPLLPVFVKRPR